MSIVREFQPFGSTRDRLCDVIALLLPNLTTVALVFWAASRFYYPVTFSFWISFVSQLILVSFALGGAFFAKPPGKSNEIVFAALTFGLFSLSIVGVTKALAGDLSWVQAGAIAIVLTMSLVVSRWLLAIGLGNRALSFAEGLRWALLQCVGVYAIHPYVRSAQVGLGDMYHYSITLADAIGQVRAGVFPIFVGQTLFSFNGGIHTLRTAPYFAHLGVFLDFVTLHTLPPYALCNIAILFACMMGTLGSYTAMVIYAPKRRWVALGLAALFVLSPGILSTLFEEDMVATFMAVPMIPWFVLGLAMAADYPNGWKPWLYQSTALAGLWWAHPPTAIWATGLCAIALLVVLARGGVTRLGIARMSMAALLCAILAGYVFTSVLTLKLPPGPDTQASEAATIIGNIRVSWPATIEPLNTGGDHSLGDIQLGYGLFAFALIGICGACRRSSAWVLMGYLSCIAILLVPLPGVTSWLWLHVPKAVLDVTNNWPMQRLFPILAGLAAFVSLAGLSEYKVEGLRWTAVLALAMSAALAWSVVEAQKLFAGANVATISPEKSELIYRPENVTLTRVSYMFFGEFPNYFSNSPTEPFLETRLLDARTLAIIADGASILKGSKAPQVSNIDFRDSSNDSAQLEISIPPKETELFRFDFLGRVPRGELHIEGRTLQRLYELPSSGGTKSFGAGPENGRALAIRNYSNQAEKVKMRFVRDPLSGDGGSLSDPFARVTIERFETTNHVIDLQSLVPFSALVHANQKCILETPRVEVPGYHASVNGSEVAIVRTGEGLVGVPIAAGINDVRIVYRGPLLLRLIYGISVAAWFAIGAFLCAFPILGRSKAFARGIADLDASLSHLIVPGLTVIAIGVALAYPGMRLWRWATAPTSGTVRLIVRLPADGAGVVEPLLTSGRTGKGDVIYIKFLGGNRLSIGYDHWGRGGPNSEPIEVDFAKAQTVDITMRSLARRSIWNGRPDALLMGVHVKWNGKEVISTTDDSYPQGPVEIGTNSIGTTSCGPLFNGEVLEIKPIGRSGSL